MRVHRLEACLRLLLFTLLLPSPAHPSAGDEELAAGLRQVREGDFETAVVTLDAATRRLAREGGREAELREGYVALGVALVALDQRTPAKERFRLALALDPKLALGSDRYSPKVIGVFEEARQEALAEETARRAEATAGKTPASPPRGGSSKLPLVLLGAGGVAAAAVALGGDDAPNAGGDARFTGARFGTPVLVCPDGTLRENLPVAVLVDAQGGSGPTTVSGVTAVLRIEASPSVPSEVGFASTAPATITPSSVAAGAAVTLRVDTTLLCNNGTGDEPRVNEWRGRLTLSTPSGPVTLETADLMTVNIP